MPLKVNSGSPSLSANIVDVLNLQNLAYLVGGAVLTAIAQWTDTTNFGVWGSIVAAVVSPALNFLRRILKDYTKPE